MNGIDWRNAFDLNENKQWNVEDKGSWEKEQKIEAIVDDLARLEKEEQGNFIAVNLKLKYWADLPYQELVGNISPLKSKSEISQRFYFLEGHEGISVDEAYGFLQNRWLEKQLQLKRKQSEDANEEDMQKGSRASSGSRLLTKKRLNKGTRKNKSIQN